MSKNDIVFREKVPAIETNDTKHLISIGAGKNQLKLIKVAIDLGYHVTAIDQKLNDDISLKNFEYLECSTYNFEKAVTLLKGRYKKKLPEGLLYRTSGPAIKTAGYVADALCLSSPSLKSTIASFAKSQLFRDCKANKLPTPNTKTFHEFPNMISNWKSWVIKPDAPIYGKKNVFLPSNHQEAFFAFQSAMSESANKLVNVQKYIEGTNVSVMVLCHNYLCKRMIHFDEWVEVDNSKCITGLGITFPSSNLSKKCYENIKNVINRLLKFWSVKNGILFFSFRVDKKDVAWLYELNLGLSGDAIAEELLPSAFGTTLNEICRIDILLNCGISCDLPTTSTPVGFIKNKKIFGVDLDFFIKSKLSQR